MIPLILEAKSVEADTTGHSRIVDDTVNQVHSTLDTMTHSAVTDRKSDSRREKILENSGQTSPDDRDNLGFNDASEWSSFAYVDGNKTRLIVGVNGKKPTCVLELQEIAARHQAEIVSKISIKSEVRAVVVELLFASVAAFVEEIHAVGLASYVEPDMKVQAQFVPNDPYWSLQWGPQRIEADWAWDTTIGNPSVLVAVVDTGIYYYHEDIAANYATGGYDWANNDPDPIDDHGHGTHCAGIIAAVLNNGIGIAGLAQVRVMAEKVLDSWGNGYWDWVANGIIHATDFGARIISMSLGGYGESALLHEAVKYAYDSGVLVIAAAGNDNTNMKSYPAAYDEVVAVAATDQYDYQAWFSNWGDWIELAAPGVDIFSTVLWGYESWSGTSMACPHVAGVAALVWSAFPTKTRDWVRQWLRYTADDLGDPGFDVYYGYGRVNARKAVETTPPVHELIAYDLITPPWVKPGALAIINATVVNFGESDETDVEVQLLANDTIADSTLIGLLVSGNSATVNLLWNPTIEGLYNVTLYVVPVPEEYNIANNVKSVKVFVSTLSMALFQNWNPWGYPSNEEALERYGIPYTVFSSSDFGRVDLSAFTKVIIASDQDQAFYNGMDTYRWWFEDYVSNGGILEIHAADFGWNGGQWVGALPGGLQWTHQYGQYVTVVDPASPLLTTPNMITEAELDNWNYAVHGYFSAYPPDAHVIIIEDSTSMPAYLELRYGSGFIIASSQTLEWAYSHRFSLILENSLLYMPKRYEHDVAVYLKTPRFLEPGNSVLLNATICNCGLNDETNVELLLLINGTMVSSAIIPELPLGSSYTINYLWTPQGGLYNLTAYAPPLPREEFTRNNIKSTILHVRYMKFVLWDNTKDTDGDSLTGNYLSLYKLLTANGFIVDELTIGPINSAVLANYDILVLMDPELDFSPYEIADIQSWVASGGALIIIPDGGYPLTINALMAPYGVQMTGRVSWYGPTTNIASHPITQGVSSIYVDGAREISATPPSTILAWTPDFYAFLSVTEAGEVVVVSDSNIMDNNGLGMADNTQLMLNIFNWVGIKLEHDLAVSLDVPKFLEPGNSVLLNATVRNRGLSNETNVELKLLINDTIVDSMVVSELLTGESYALSYLWTPTLEGIYNITANAPPVPGENFTVNNWCTKFTRITYAVMIGIIETHGETIHAEELANYYASLGHVVEKITTTITPDVLSNYDVIIVGEWGYIAWLPSEIAAVKAYIDSGKGFVAIGDELDIYVQEILGTYGISYTGISGTGGSTSNFDPLHPIMQGVSLIFASNPVNSLRVTAPAYYIANDIYNEHILIAGAETGGYVLCLSNDFAFDLYADDNEIMFENIIDWVTVRYEHELVVSLDAPRRLSPGDSVLLNATVRNRGLNNETDVELYLVINGTVVSSATIPELLVDKPYTINYLWTPTVEATYNLTAYAPPLPDENVTANNLVSKTVHVRYLPRLLVVDTPLPEDTGALDILEYEYTLVTPTEFATVDLYHYNVLFIGWEPGDALVDALFARESDIADWVAAGNGIVALAEFEEVNRWAWLPLWVSGSSGFHADTVHILNPAHPVMSGLTDTELSGWGLSYHGYFAGYDPVWEALAEGVESGQPITLAAAYGAGRIAITNQDPDFHLYYEHEEGAGKLLRNMIEWVTPSFRQYTLAVHSLPNGITFTVDGISYTTPWSETYSEGTPVNLEMPETYTVGDARYYWNQWSDGNTSPSRTVAMTTNIALTAYFAGPYYQLTITSLPITGIEFTIDGIPKTTPYTEWLLEGSYTLEMPETYSGYVWSHWLEDEDTNRIKTIALPGHKWTTIYVLPVGGKTTPINMPMNEPEVPALWIWLLTFILPLVATAAFVKLKKKKQ